MWSSSWFRPPKVFAMVSRALSLSRDQTGQREEIVAAFCFLLAAEICREGSNPTRSARTSIKSISYGKIRQPHHTTVQTSPSRPRFLPPAPAGRCASRMAEHRAHSPDVRAVSERTRKMSRTMTMCATSHIGKSTQGSRKMSRRMKIFATSHKTRMWNQNGRTPRLHQNCKRGLTGQYCGIAEIPAGPISLPTRRPGG